MIVDFGAVYPACRAQHDFQNGAQRAHERKQHRDQYWAKGVLVNDSDHQRNTDTGSAKQNAKEQWKFLRLDAPQLAPGVVCQRLWLSLGVDKSTVGLHLQLPPISSRAATSDGWWTAPRRAGVLGSCRPSWSGNSTMLAGGGYDMRLGEADTTQRRGAPGAWEGVRRWQERVSSLSPTEVRAIEGSQAWRGRRSSPRSAP